MTPERGGCPLCRTQHHPDAVAREVTRQRAGIAAKGALVWQAGPVRVDVPVQMAGRGR